MSNQSPLVNALRTAGDSTVRMATNLKFNGYTVTDANGAPDDARAMAYLADALFADFYDMPAANDRMTVADRLARLSSKRRAQDRLDWLASVDASLTKCSRDLRVVIVDALAAGDGNGAALVLERIAGAVLRGTVAAIHSASTEEAQEAA